MIIVWTFQIQNFNFHFLNSLSLTKVSQPYLTLHNKMIKMYNNEGMFFFYLIYYPSRPLYRVE